MNELKFVKEEKKYLLLKISGVILTMLTFWLVFILWYEFFFEHEMYKNKRILYKYLKKNKAKLIYDRDMIYLDDVYYIQIWRQREYSIHDKNSNCIISDFVGSLCGKILNYKTWKIIKGIKGNS
jgi:hypothetical protein